MKKIKEELIQKIKDELDYLIFQELKNYNAVIAGGMITSLFTGRKINDYDVYFKDIESFENAICFIKKKNNIIDYYTTDNAVSIKYDPCGASYESHYIKIQFIRAPHLFFENPKDLIANFDFTINMAAYDLATEELIIDDRFIEDNIKRELIFNEDTLYPIVSLHRAVKYMERGYKLTGYEQVKIALAINNLHMKNYRDLKVQLQGIDTSVFAPITEKLMETPDVEYNYKTIKDILKEE